MRTCTVDGKIHDRGLDDLTLDGRTYPRVCELHRRLAVDVWLADRATVDDETAVRVMINQSGT